ncbi:MAG: dihydrolipoyl dehydrogenase [Caldisericaceae bacterium]
MEEFDVVILGAGSAGYVSAIRAADLGKKVLIVEGRDIGGTCLNRGCIPTKAILRAAEVYAEAKESKVFGVDSTCSTFNIGGIQNWKETVVKRLVSGVDFLLKSRKVVVIRGTGKLVDGNVIEVETATGKETYKGTDVIIATGSEPAMIPDFKIDHNLILTSDDALNLKKVPKDILIVGAGAIGVEFGTFFTEVGSKVTIVEMMPQVIPTLCFQKKKPCVDAKIAAMAQRILTKKGMTIKTGVKIVNIEAKGGKVFSTLDNGEVIETENVLVSIGRKLNSDGIGLEKVGIATDRSRIIVDEYLRTNIPHHYAIGDVVGGMLLAHKAMKEGEVAAEIIAGNDIKMDYRVVPWAIFTTPEIAAVGISEEEAKAQGIEVVTGEFPFSANGKAISMNSTDGVVRIIGTKETHEIIGAQIIGPDASVMIAELALAEQKHLTLEDVAHTIHTHPTVAESTMEAAKVPLGEVIHIAQSVRNQN